MSEHTIEPFKSGPVIPVPSCVFDECVTCGKPIEGEAIINGLVMAWHAECYPGPVFEPSSFIDAAADGV